MTPCTTLVETATTSFLLQCPTELLTLIFGYLSSDLKALSALSQSCRFLRILTHSSSTTFSCLDLSPFSSRTTTNCLIRDIILHERTGFGAHVQDLCLDGCHLLDTNLVLDVLAEACKSLRRLSWARKKTRTGAGNALFQNLFANFTYRTGPNNGAVHDSETWWLGKSENRRTDSTPNPSDNGDPSVIENQSKTPNLGLNSRRGSTDDVLSNVLLIKLFRNCTNTLSHLALSYHHLDIESFGSFSLLKNLTSLDLRWTSLDNPALQTILSTHGSHLLSLKLAGTHLSDLSLLCLNQNCHEIRDLYIHLSPNIGSLTAAKLGHSISAMQKLQSLEITGCDFSDVDRLLSSIPFPSGKPGSHCVEKGLNEFPLTSLSLAPSVAAYASARYRVECPLQITDQGLQHLATRCPNLQTLRLANPIYISSIGLRSYLSVCGANLTVLELRRWLPTNPTRSTSPPNGIGFAKIDVDSSNISMPEDPLETLPITCPNLTLLVLWGFFSTPNLSSQTELKGFAHWAHLNGFPLLRDLTLVETPNLTAPLLEDVVATCPQLNLLALLRTGISKREDAELSCEQGLIRRKSNHTKASGSLHLYAFESAIKEAA